MSGTERAEKTLRTKEAMYKVRNTWFMKLSTFSGISAVIVGAALSANAIPITIGSAERTGTLDWAIAAATASGSGNLDAAMVGTAFGGTWIERGHLDPSTPSSDDLLTISITSGAWGGNNVAGTWTISSSFWSAYADAVIGWHVGVGSGDPDDWMFLVKPGQTSGTFSYDRLTGGGGGFSNMQLFGSGTGNRVPDSGLTLTLLGFGLMGLGALRRKLG